MQAVGQRIVDGVDGGIGELRLIRSVFSYSLYDENNIRLNTELEGGALMDVGCYNVSGSRLFGGEPTLTPPSDSIANMRVIDAIYVAAGMQPRGT